MMPIGKDLWGRDHTSTFLYLETRVVDGGGFVDRLRMRPKSEQYPTRLNNETTVALHSDFDCVWDFVCAGLATEDDEGRYALTSAGWTYASELRQARAAQTAEQIKAPR